MMRSMFAAISGLKAHQVMLDVTAADIANVNTLGYKSSRMTFRDSLSQMQRGGAAPGPGQGGSNSAQVGLGSQVGSIDNLMTGGSLQTTGNPLDVAINGEGWFRVGSSTAPAAPTGIAYTRAGNFTTNSAGYLTTQDGLFVVGRVVAGYISLAKFPNQSALERQGANTWIAGANAGGEVVSTPGGSYGIISSGAVEMSNVDLASEFTNMITAQRGFQANSRVISTADQMLQDLVNLVR
jgi:flagellar hook protein FlgE